MPIEYTVLEDKRLVMAKGFGVVTAEDVIKHLKALAADKRYVAPMKKLVDYRSIDDIKQSNEEVLFIADLKTELKKTFDGEKCAFVTTKDLAFGIARVHAASVEGTGIDSAAFRDIEEALGWLEVDLDKGFEK